MTFLYTAIEPFNNTCTELPKDWKGYVRFSGLTHLTEIVSLDILLNEPHAYANVMAIWRHKTVGR